MATKNKRIGYTVAALLAFAALMTGLFVNLQLHQTKAKALADFNGTRLSEPRAIQDFSLQGSDGHIFNNESLKGKWTLVFFGFTRCGYLCPTTLAELAKTFHLLQEKNVEPLPQVVFISVDPERDSLEKIKTYITAFDPHFLGVRGDDKAVREFANGLGVVYEKISTKNNQENYDIQHNGAVILFNPQGELAAFFTSPQQAALLAADYQLLVS